MEQTKIDRYVDNLDVNTQADLLKKTLNLLFIFNDNENITRIEEDEVDFIRKQINEFNEKRRDKKRILQAKN